MIGFRMNTQLQQAYLPTQPNMKGVTLIAIGKYGYLQWAINMALSVKYDTPDCNIQLITSEFLKPDAEAAKANYGCFDILTVVPNEAYMDEGRLFPAKLKTSFYDYLAFDETVYLDVDGCMIKDISPLFDIKADFASDVQAVYDITQGDRFEAMKWARINVVYEHFKLPACAKFPALNSSFMFIRKSETAKSIFANAYNELMNNPLPLEKHWYSWGQKRKTKNNQPDELYMNVALAKLGIIPEHIGAINFRMINEGGQAIPLQEIAKSKYGIGLFGELRINHISMREHYNRHMKTVWQYMVKSGEPFSAKCEILSQHKFAVQ